MKEFMDAFKEHRVKDTKFPFGGVIVVPCSGDVGHVRDAVEKWCKDNELTYEYSVLRRLFRFDELPGAELGIRVVRDEYDTKNLRGLHIDMMGLARYFGWSRVLRDELLPLLRYTEKKLRWIEL